MYYACMDKEEGGGWYTLKAPLLIILTKILPKRTREPGEKQIIFGIPPPWKKKMSGTSV